MKHQNSHKRHSYKQVRSTYPTTIYVEPKNCYNIHATIPGERARVYINTPARERVADHIDPELLRIMTAGAPSGGQKKSQTILLVGQKQTHEPADENQKPVKTPAPAMEPANATPERRKRGWFIPALLGTGAAGLVAVVIYKTRKN